MLFGMLPLAMKAESGGESRAPMAVVVIGAIITSTALATIVLPAVYTLFDDLQMLLGRSLVCRPRGQEVAGAAAGPSAVPVADGLGAPAEHGVQSPVERGAVMGITRRTGSPKG
jgi:hypothetical protein